MVALIFKTIASLAQIDKFMHNSSHIPTAL